MKKKGKKGKKGKKKKKNHGAHLLISKCYLHHDVDSYPTGLLFYFITRYPWWTEAT